MKVDAPDEKGNKVLKAPISDQNKFIEALAKDKSITVLDLTENKF